MNVIALNAPEGHDWHGTRLHVHGAARHAILTLHGAFNWCPVRKHWAWASDPAVTLHWPEPSSPEHAALMAQFAETRPPRRAAKGEAA